MKKAVWILLAVIVVGIPTVFGLIWFGAFNFPSDTASVPAETSSVPEPESEPESAPEPEPAIPEIVQKSAEVKAAYDEIFDKYDPVGVSLAVFENGEIVYTYNNGYRDLKNKIKCDSDTKYRVASLSKTYVALTAMHMVDEGLLDLDRNVEDYLGYRVRAYGYPQDEITMRMLLTHTSSIYDCPKYVESTQGTFHSKQSILASGTAYTGKKPGTYYVYSNFGLSVAGAVLEAAIKGHVSEYARSNIFMPLGIDASFVPKELADTENVANCYGGGHAVAKSTDKLMQMSDNNGIGNLVISAKDYAVGLMMLLNGGDYKGTRVLSEKSAKEMTTVQFVDEEKKVREALCMREWTVFAQYGRRLLCHSGDFYGILSAYAVDPETKSGVVVITNGAKQTKDKVTQYYKVCYDYLRETFKYI